MGSSNVIEGMKGSVAAGGIAVPAIEPIYGNYLTTHGFELLSYAESMQVIGTIYVSWLLIKSISNSSVGKKIKAMVLKWFDK